MYLGRKPKRQSSRRILSLLVLIAAASLFLYYVWTYQPRWSQPFEATPTPTRTPDSYVAEAEAYYGQGQIDAAIAAYEQAVAVDPELASARLKLAQLLTLRQKTAQAVHQAQQAVMLEPSDPLALGALCQALDWHGSYAEAFDICECAIELDPQYAEAYAYLAKTYVDTGDWIPAREYAQQAVDLNYQSMEAHYNQGMVLEAQARYREAAEAYENAIVLHPKLALLYISAGQNYRVLGQFTEAIDRFEKAIRLDPASPVGYDQLGWTYYTSGQYDRAIDTLEQATAIAPEYMASWGHLGIVYYVLQQYEEVIPALQEAVSLAEKDYLRRAQRVVIIGQDTTRDPPQPLDVLRGDFLPPDDAAGATLRANLSPVFSPQRMVPQPGQTCGDLIASQLRRQTSTAEPTPPAAGGNSGSGAAPADVPPPLSRFLGTGGQVTLDVNQKLLQLTLSGVPQPEGIPYEAQLFIWSDETLSLGYFQPDVTGEAQLDFNFGHILPAPIDYYTLLGFSHVFLGQCDRGVPWLLDSVDIDPDPGNPAWQGLADCPENPPPEETEPTS
jgi:tetratricopeptide (TPR) repeat protein